MLINVECSTLINLTTILRLGHAEGKIIQSIFPILDCIMSITETIYRQNQEMGVIVAKDYAGITVAR